MSKAALLADDREVKTLTDVPGVIGPVRLRAMSSEALWELVAMEKRGENVLAVQKFTLRHCLVPDEGESPWTTEDVDELYRNKSAATIRRLSDEASILCGWKKPDEETRAEAEGN